MRPRRSVVHDDALDYLRKSAQIDANRTSVARTRVLIAGELRALGDLARRRERTREGTGSTATRWCTPTPSRNARGCARAQHDPAAAIADLRAADSRVLALGLDFNRIDTNTALSRALLAAGDIPGASAAADEAVSITARIRVKSANPEWRARFLSARYAPYEARIAVDLAGGSAEASWRGFRTAEEVRARSLADQLALGPGRAQANREADGLRAKLTSLQLRLETRIAEAGPRRSGTIELRRAIEETRAQGRCQRSGGVAARQVTLPDSLHACSSRCRRRAAVLAYFVGDYDSHAWLLTRDTLRHRSCRAWRRCSSDIDAGLAAQRTAAARIAATDSAATLLGDLLDGVAATRMLVIPDGPLNGVPFAALSAGPRP